MEYKQLIDNIINDKSEHSFEVIHDNFRTKVYRIDTPEMLIMRITKEDIRKVEFDYQLLNAINDPRLTSVILHFEERDIDGETFSISIQKYISGAALTSYPNNEVTKSIIESTFELTTKLREVSTQFNSLGIPSLKQIFSSITTDLKNKKLSEWANFLLENDDFVKVLNDDHQVLTHFDMWPENILIDEKQVRFIDLDPLFYGSKEMQAPILFSSFFLLGSYLFNQRIKFNLDELIRFWPETLEKRKTLILMLVFPLGLAINKEQSFEKGNGLTKEEHQKVQEPLFYSIEYILTQLKD